MNSSFLSSYTVQARHVSGASENQVHDDAVATRLGFAAAILSGSAIYSYMTHLAVERWGEAWLRSGTADIKFLKPVYDGDPVLTRASEKDGELQLELTVGEKVCACGSVAMRPDDSCVPTYRPAEERRQALEAGEESLAPGTRFGLSRFPLDREFASRWVSGVSERHALYELKSIAHPGIFLRICNQTLARNVTLGPWIHASSRVRHFSPAPVGDALSATAEVLRNYAHKGHRFVDLDISLWTQDRRPVARILHVAIYRPAFGAATA